MSVPLFDPMQVCRKCLGMWPLLVVLADKVGRGHGNGECPWVCLTLRPSVRSSISVQGLIRPWFQEVITINSFQICTHLLVECSELICFWVTLAQFWSSGPLPESMMTKIYYAMFGYTWTLCPTDAIWRQRSGSTLAQVMARFLQATSLCLHQCWLMISIGPVTFVWR